MLWAFVNIKQAEDIENNAEYLATVTVGTPGQQLALDFDTGSADLWVWSTELPSSLTSQAGDNKHTIFDPKKSSTFKKTSGSTWSISYGDGSTASGDVGTDSVTAGGLVVKNQAIELAKTLSTQFAQGPGDGLLGLAFGSINTVQPGPVNTLVENMIAQSDIAKGTELFTAYLGSTGVAGSTATGSSSETDATSFYTFGYVDEDALNGQTPSYTPVDSSQGFWMFDSSSAKVGNKTVTRAGNTAIADTGTTLALVGDDLCEAVYGSIKGAKQSSQQQVRILTMVFLVKLADDDRDGSFLQAPTFRPYQKSRLRLAMRSSPSTRKSCRSRILVMVPTTVAFSRVATRASIFSVTSSCAPCMPSSIRATHDSE